jgi:2-alkenal reductase
MPPRLRIAVLAAAVLAAGVAACGDDDSGSEKSEDRKVETTRVQVVEQSGREEGFDPEGLYERLSPGVVTILSIFDGGVALFEDDGEGGQGSGFVLDDRGYIATNAHVVTSGRPPRTRRAKEVYVEFSDGNRVRARIVGDDPNSDVALLKIDPKGLSLTPLKFGSSSELEVGEPVVAIGSPFGEPESMSVGIISALDRNIESLTAFGIGDAIQTDAAINPGNSGGPLLSAGGAVLGINAQIKTSSGSGAGVGFAIPVDAVKRSVGELRKEGRVSYGYLGVTSLGLYPQLAERLDLSVKNGAIVQKVEPDSPADDADLETGDDEIDFQGGRDIPKDGDVIVAVDGKEVTRHRDLADLISQKSEGDEIELDVVRGDDRREVKVELGRRPARPPEE